MSSSEDHTFTEPGDREELGPQLARSEANQGSTQSADLASFTDSVERSSAATTTAPSPLTFPVDFSDDDSVSDSAAADLSSR